MAVRISTLSENTASFGFLAEWGLSILVETNTLRILLDTGAGMCAVHNAEVLGIGLAPMDRVVLSNRSSDHTGGLRDVLRRTGRVEVVGHPSIWEARYTVRGERQVYDGIPFRREELEGLGALFNLTREPVYLGDGIMTTGEIPMTTSFEEPAPDTYVRRDGELQRDEVADDLGLVIDTSEGLVVVLGCAHRGVVNALLHARQITGNRPVHSVVGGMHLFRAPESQVDETVRALKEMGVKRLGASHCTGFRASARMAREFGDGFFLNNAGTCLTLP